VDVEHGLTRVRPGVDHHAVTTLQNPLFSGQLPGGQKECPHELGVGLLEVGDTREMSPGNDENVGRRLRVNVPEGEELGGLQDDIRRDLTLRDATEKTTGVGQEGPAFLPMRVRYPETGSALRSSCPRANQGITRFFGSRPRAGQRTMTIDALGSNPSRPLEPLACPDAP
jgi:hypothetical protein